MKKTKRTFPLSKLLIVLLVLMLTASFVFIHFLYRENVKLTETVANQEKEIANYLSGYSSPTWPTEYTEDNYSFGNFGIESNLFKDKTVSTQEWEYKRNIITQKTLAFEGENNDRVSVSTWRISDKKPFASDLPPTALEGQWEGVLPVSIDEIIENNIGKYTNPEGIEMYFTTTIFRKVIGLKLSYLRPYSPIGDNLLVQLSTPVEYLEVDDQTEVIEVAKNRLIEIAETITVR